MSILIPSVRKPYSVTRDQFDPNDAGSTWAYIEARLAILLFEGREDIKERTKLYVEIYHATHAYCAAMGPFSDQPVGKIVKDGHRRGIFLYLKLVNYIEENLCKILKQLKFSPYEDPLIIYTREWDRFTDSSVLLSRVMRRLNHAFVSYAIAEGFNPDYRGHLAIYDIRNLHNVQRDSILIPKVQKKIHFAVWKAAITGSMGGTIRHPAIEQIINLSSIRRPMTLPSNLKLRRIVLLTRPVDRLQGIMNKVGNPDGRGLVTLSHWALLIEDEPYQGTLHEIRVEEGASRPRTQFYTQTDGWTRQVVGNTLLNDSSIREYVKMVSLMMQKQYRPLSNNCQRFCIDLFHSIRIPCNEKDMLNGIEQYPYEFSGIIRSRRCREFEHLAHHRSTGNLILVSPIPTPIETYTVLALNTAPIIFIQWVEINAWRLVYMIFLFSLYSLYAKPRGVGFKLISRRKEDPFKTIYRELHQKGLHTRQRRLHQLGSSNSTVSALRISKGRRKVTMPILSRKQGTTVRGN